jgi:hypothetical protein
MWGLDIKPEIAALVAEIEDGDEAAASAIYVS